jgi:hypothetical protein
LIGCGKLLDVSATVASGFQEWHLCVEAMGGYILRKFIPRLAGQGLYLIAVLDFTFNRSLVRIWKGIPGSHIGHDLGKNWHCCCRLKE